jgi:hypothetical protein
MALEVTFQVNLAPADFPHARHTLPHQLRQWSSQVDEFLLTTDLHRVKHGHFGEGWDERRAPLAALIAECAAEFPNIRALDVDYSAAASRRVSDTFFRGRPVPAKDLRGAPIYPYYFGLEAAKHDVVMHIDSDMMFGGGSQTWVEEALDLFAADPNVLTCSPLAGPPTHNGTLPGQPTATTYPALPTAFRFHWFSTRIFALSKRRFAERIGGVEPRRPELRGAIRAMLQGNPMADLAENVLSDAMVAAGMYRVDFLGSADGMWSLHPPYRSAAFYEQLPELIARIESGDVPEAQRGYYDINDALFDWSTARAAKQRKPWWVRVGLWAAGNPYRVPGDVPLRGTSTQR